MWTLTIPKLLRPYFLHRRKLLGPLCRAGWETVAELISEAAGRGVRPGMVGTVHTATSDLLWSPHVHAIASRGGWDPDGVWHPVPYVDEKSAELLFRHKVITLLADEGLITPDRLQLLDSWKSGHTGFSAHHRVTVPAGDPAGLERLARYLLRAPLSLERLELEGSLARYRQAGEASRRGAIRSPRSPGAAPHAHSGAPAGRGSILRPLRQCRAGQPSS